MKNSLGFSRSAFGERNPYGLWPGKGSPTLAAITGIIIFILVIGWTAPGQAQGLEKQFQEGKKLYEGTCADCHRINGQGLPEKFPALDKNHFVGADPAKIIDTVLNGRKGKLGQMPAWRETFDDRQVAAIITYVRQAWSNKGSVVTAEMVKKRRK